MALSAVVGIVAGGDSPSVVLVGIVVTPQESTLTTFRSTPPSPPHLPEPETNIKVSNY